MKLALLLLARLWRFSRRAALWALPLVVFLSACSSPATSTDEEKTRLLNALERARTVNQNLQYAYWKMNQQLIYVCPEHFTNAGLATAPTSNARQLPPLTRDDLLRYNRCGEAARMKAWQ